VKQVTAATRELTSPRRTKRTPTERVVLAALAEAGARDVTVRSSGGKLTLGNIDPAIVRTLARVLAALQLPQEA
jgi:hypothetical protein